MEDLNKIANDIALHTNGVVKVLNDKYTIIIIKVNHAQGQHPTQVKGKRNANVKSNV